jgi:hypothetical protein
MRCLTPAETVEALGGAGFSSPHAAKDAYRIDLLLDGRLANQQTRLGARPTPHIDRLAYFTDALNRWHASNTRRLLWVTHWDSVYPGAYETFVGARRGLGETRSLAEAPGHCFDAHAYDNQDPLTRSSDQEREASLLAGLTSLVMINGWDAWLIAEGSVDRIEFWEGNLFFHSATPSRIAEAERLLEDFDCPRDPK